MRRNQTRGVKIVGILVCLLSSTLKSDEYIPFVDFRRADPTSRTYVVIRRIGGPVFDSESGPVEMLIAHRAPGTEPVLDAVGLARTYHDFRETSARKTEVVSTVGIRDGDRIVNRHRLRRPPTEVMFMTHADRIVALGERPPGDRVYSDAPAIRIYGLQSGILKREIHLNSLYNKDHIELLHTYGHWRTHTWRNAREPHFLYIACSDDNDKTANFREGLSPNQRIRALNVLTGDVKWELPEIVVESLEGAHPRDLETLVGLSNELQLKSSATLLENISIHCKDMRIRILAKEALESFEPDE